MIESLIDWNSEYYFFSSSFGEIEELEMKITIDISFIDSYELDGSTSLKYHGLVFRILDRVQNEYFFAVIPNLLEDKSLNDCVYFEYSGKIVKIFEIKKLWSEIW